MASCIDLVAIPDFAVGAMENWGLITYRLTSLLYDKNKSSDSNKQWVAVVVAHELAHQVCAMFYKKYNYIFFRGRKHSKFLTFVLLVRSLYNLRNAHFAYVLYNKVN